MGLCGKIGITALFEIMVLEPENEAKINVMVELFIMSALKITQHWLINVTCSY